MEKIRDPSHSLGMTDQFIEQRRLLCHFDSFGELRIDSGRNLALAIGQMKIVHGITYGHFPDLVLAGAGEVFF